MANTLPPWARRILQGLIVGSGGALLSLILAFTGALDREPGSRLHHGTLVCWLQPG